MAMDLEGIGLYRKTLDNLEGDWRQVLESHSLRVCVIEGDSGMWKSRTVLQFLHKNQIPAIISRASRLPEPLLPLRLAFDSVLQLEEVQAQLSLPPNDVTQPWRIALTVLASVIPLLRPDPIGATHNEWKALEQWGVYRLPVIGTGESDVEDSGRKSVEPLTLPGVLTEALGELSGLFPLVFMVDDFDLCDSSTLDVIRFTILPALMNKPILVVFALEDSTRESEVHKFLKNIDESHATQHFALDHLSVDEVTRITANELTSLAPKHVDVIGKIIHEATGGLMAEVEDTLHWVRDTGVQAVLANPEMVPRHDQLMRDQFDHLTNIERSVLKAASVQGRYFCVPVVASVLATTTDYVLGILAGLENRLNSWVKEDSVVRIGSQDIPWYRYRGRQRYEKTYKYIPQSDRITYHLSTGIAFQALYHDHETTIASLLAMQFEEAGVKKEAAKYYAILAGQANLLGDFDSGANLAQRGLDNLLGHDDLQALQCRLLIEKGRALRHTERARLAIALLEEANDLAVDLGDRTLQLESSLYLCELLIQRNRWEGIKYLLQALDLTRGLKNWTIAASILEDLREPYFKGGKGREFIDLCNRMVDEIRQTPTSDSRTAIAEILEDVAWIEYKKARFDHAISAAASALEELAPMEQTDYFAEIFFKLHRRRAEALERMDSLAYGAQSLDEADRAFAWAKQSRQRRHQASALVTRANVLQSLGRVDEGERAYVDALKLLEDSVDLRKLSEIEADFGLFLSQTGRKSRAKDMYERAVEHSDRASDFKEKQIAQNNLAAILKHIGKFNSSLAILRQLYNEALAQEIPDKSRQSIALNHIGDILRIQNNLTEAERHHRQAIELAAEMEDLSRRAFSTRYLGQALLAQWENDEAETVIKSAVELQEQAHPMRMRYYSQVFLGRILINKGDSVHALRVLEEADRVFRELKNLEWEGIANLNRGLALLCLGRTIEALTATQSALKVLEVTESWRVNEAYHLLARCNLALGEFDQGRESIARAKQGFMRLRLFHRLYQAELTELGINQSSQRNDWSRWHVVSNDELRRDFNHLGV